MGKSFTFRCIAYQDSNGTFTGVCLDLNIVEEEHGTLEETIFSINEAIESHFQVAKKLNFPDNLMSRPAPKEYWDKLKEITEKEDPIEKRSRSFQFYTREVPTLNYA